MASKLPFMRICLLPAHLSDDELKHLEAQIPTLTRDASKADVFVGKLSKKARARFELRRLGIATEEEAEDEAEEEANSPPAVVTETVAKTSPRSSGPAAKRRKSGHQESSPIIILSSSEDEDEGLATQIPSSQPAAAAKLPRPKTPRQNTVIVVKLAWFNDSLACKKVLPFSGYIVYEGQRIPGALKTQQAGSPLQEARFQHSRKRTVSKSEGILQRAQADAVEAGGASSRQHSQTSPTSQLRRYDTPSRRRTHQTSTNPPAFFRRTTSENGDSVELPPIPDYLQTTYSCERPTPIHPPNEEFIGILKKIRLTRELMGDKIGERAYSSSIASLAAYPYKLSVPVEVARLPGCGPKIAELFREYDDSGGHVLEAEDSERDPKLAVLRLFYGIWGVAEATARAFYNRGWRDLDDVVEFGWPELSRVQQIGVKYYDELQELMTRAQVEAIADRVLDHANSIHPGFHMVIAGGYRRGKAMSGDVDVILSHPDESATHFIIRHLVLSLEKAGLVTHTLTLSTTNSDRGQEPVSWKGGIPRHHIANSSDTGHSGGLGFDTLDKALVVWQEPLEELDKNQTESGGGSSNHHDSNATSETLDVKEIDQGTSQPKKKNTNLHRRVDILIAPWKTVGCTVLGWSGGTTFQRDLRRYCKHIKGLRFDSSGARSEVDGSWIDLENYAHDPSPDMLTAERRVFDALELEWRPPDERCTG